MQTVLPAIFLLTLTPSSAFILNDIFPHNPVTGHDSYTSPIPDHPSRDPTGDSYTSDDNNVMMPGSTAREPDFTRDDQFFTQTAVETTSDAGDTATVAWPIISTPEPESTDCDEGTTPSWEEVFGTSSEGPVTSQKDNETTDNRCEVYGPRAEEIKAVYNFSNSADFKQLSENQRLFVYELLATVEGCQVARFLTVDTMQRFLLLTQDLPLKYVNQFLTLLSKSLTWEGITVPV